MQEQNEKLPMLKAKIDEPWILQSAHKKDWDCTSYFQNMWYPDLGMVFDMKSLSTNLKYNGTQADLSV